VAQTEEQVRQQARRFFLGCAVWAYKDWVGHFFPTKSRSADFLRLYSERLTAVEGNTTFYSVPSPEMVRRWAMETPPAFQFCLKFPKTISHQGLLSPRLEEAIAFLKQVQGLGARLGPLMLQLPPSYGGNSLQDLQEFLGRWEEALGDRGSDRPAIAVELRHLDWFEAAADTVNALLSSHRVGRIVLDTRPVYESPDDPQVASERRKPPVPLLPEVTAPFAIVRYISHPVQERNQVYLAEWADRVSWWLAQGTQVYFFVHCPQEIHSPAIARYFQAQLEHQNAAVPPLPWNQLQPEDTQLSLF
jgi:uncharacterized protein YecE (DUF72 family)